MTRNQPLLRGDQFPFDDHQFRYNDRWDENPNDPDLGNVVTMEDGSRHTKWMKAVLPRLQMMKAMLKPQGVVAVCIDDNELFHLGMMMDEVFGEENRIAIVNWQKTTVKNNTKLVSATTEYVLVYAKDLEITKVSRPRLLQIVPRAAPSAAAGVVSGHRPKRGKIEPTLEFVTAQKRCPPIPPGNQHL
jgi:DNA methylase